MVSDVYAG